MLEKDKLNKDDTDVFFVDLQGNRDVNLNSTGLCPFNFDDELSENTDSKENDGGLSIALGGRNYLIKGI
jgi:hypothetical protein